MSYCATLKLTGEVSQMHQTPIQGWIKDSIIFKFWGDNVDKKQHVRDVRSDHQGQMLHMYSILAGCSRTPANDLPCTGQVAQLSSIPYESFLPTQSEVDSVKKNMTVIVCRILTDYIHELSPLAKAVPKHIQHCYSKQMAEKSEVVVLDVLMKNEACHSDMLDIMQTMQGYLGKDYPTDHRVASGGDQLTCEHQTASQRHMMDGDTPEDRLKLLEPQTEDWHCLVCFISVCFTSISQKYVGPLLKISPPSSFE